MSNASLSVLAVSGYVLPGTQLDRRFSCCQTIRDICSLVRVAHLAYLRMVCILFH